MSEPIYVPGDPARAIADFYRTELAALVGDVGADLELPSDWTPASPAHVVVFDDGGLSKPPVFDAVTVRVTVWAHGRTRAREVAGVCRGMLSARSVPGVSKLSELSPILVAFDPQNKGTTASFHGRAVSRMLAL